MRRLSIFSSATFAALIAITIGGAAQEQALAEDKIKAVMPLAWEGYERSEPEYIKAMIGFGGRGEASYRDVRGGTNFFEATLRVSDLGVADGKMYADYGAEYLKGPVANDVQKSVTVKGLPGLLTMTGETHMMVETYVGPRLQVSAVCMNAKLEECQASLERFDFDALKVLSESGGM